MDSIFFEALQNNSIELMQMVTKSDLHSHAGRGGKMQTIHQGIIPQSMPFDSLDEMQEWYNNNVKSHCIPGVLGYLQRVEAAFIQASVDNIKCLVLSFGTSEVDALGGMNKFMSIIKNFKERHIPDSRFMPELTTLRSIDIADETEKIQGLISFNWFKSIDICGNELAAPIHIYKQLYRYAKDAGLRLKAHVGEFGTADDVMEAVEVLELDELHHGIAAAQSSFIMKWLAHHNIQLNVCPTSNIMLKRADSYMTHPIRKLFDYGIAVTINTDDLAIFDASVSKEYLNLFNAKLFSENELNKIRKTGLKSVSGITF